MSVCKYDTIFVVSPEDQSGKSTFAEELGAALKLKVGETGHHIDKPLSRVLAAFWSEEAHSHHDADADRAFMALAHNKERYRPHKIAFASEMCRLDPDWMIQQSIEDGARIIVGCRRAEEIKAYLAATPSRYRILLIIIYRPKEDGVVNAAIDFLKIQVETKEICNDSTLIDLQTAAHDFASKHCL